MLSTRNQDQENIIHSHQTTGGAKSNALGPKTPGQQRPGKTPARKIALNDENTVSRVGKSKTGAKEAVQTPAPRDRAPLGAKTTNAKAKPSATPAASLTSAKPTQNLQQHRTPAQQRASARKNKLRIHHSPPQAIEDADPLGVSARPHSEVDELPAPDVADESEPEIEYCPPKAADLPDYPDPDDPFEFKPDKTFPMLEPENFMRGAWSYYHNPVGEDGLTRLQRESRKWDEETDKYIAEEERKLTEQAKNGSVFDSHSAMDDSFKSAGTVSQSETTKSGHARSQSAALDRKPPPTASSRSAATALSGTTAGIHSRSISTSNTTSTGTSRFAKPTASSKARQATVAVTTSHDSSSRTRPRGNVTLGEMASRTTMGRVKGRHVSAELRGGNPTVAARMRPKIPSSQSKEQHQNTHGYHGTSESEDRSLRVIDEMIRRYEEEQDRIRGVQGEVDESGLAALQEALNRDLDDWDDFQLDMPAEVA